MSLPVVLHDGSRILLRKLDASYDPTNRARGHRGHLRNG